MKSKIITLALLLTTIVFPQEQWGFYGFEKYENNPILLPGDYSWECKDVFNPAAVVRNDSVFLFYRAEDSTGVGKWNGTSSIGLAVSTNGIDFTKYPDPVLYPTEDYEKPGGCEDPRIVKIENKYYLTYTAYDGKTARLCLAVSEDLCTWEKKGIVFPELGWTKAGAICPEKINGKYIMYFGDWTIRIAYSDDLINWETKNRIVVGPRKQNKNNFDYNLVESGPPPIITNEGVLLIFNAADKDWKYSVGQVLFSKEEPKRILKRSIKPLIYPEKNFEKYGQVNNVIFSEGLVFFKNKWYLYFGTADSYIGVAIKEE